MKKYSSKRAKKGKLAYRTPDRFIPHQISKTTKVKSAFHRDRRHSPQRFGEEQVY